MTCPVADLMTEDLSVWINMWRNLKSDMMTVVGPMIFERAELLDGDALSVLAELDSLFNEWQAEQREARRQRI